MSISILLVDDEPMVVKAMERLLSTLDCDISSTSSPIDALQMCSDKVFDLIIADQRMPLLTGAQLLGQIREKSPQTRSVLMSAYTDFNDVIGGFNNGIVDHFIPKPWNEAEVLAIVTASASTISGTANPTSRPKNQAKSAKDNSLYDFNGLRSGSPKMMETFHKLKKAAVANMPVFISGETGTGKEMSAKAIHLESHRVDAPFISFNCANFNETLMESQIFGHKKGAFTGAVADQKGLLAEVGQGTLFLDEITSMNTCLLYTSPSPRDQRGSRMPSSA